MKARKESGITLIALVVTILILLILAGVTITLLLGEDGLFSSAQEGAFKQKMSAYKEKVNLYQLNGYINNTSKNINAGEPLKQAIADGIIGDITQDDVTIDIREIIPEITSEEKEYVVVYNGEMHYVSSENVPNNEKQTQWCTEIGIPILEYTPSNVPNGAYEEVNGVYVCTPDLSKFNKSVTYYVIYDENINESGTIPITQEAPEDWYDYQNSKWANVVLRTDLTETYYVWIPRYCFKLDQEKERSEVQFIDINNSYKDPEGNVITWEQRIAEDPSWQIPEAFKFNGQDLAGYWITKYTLGGPSKTLYADTEVTNTSIKIKEIKGEGITAAGLIYNYYINGEKKGSTNSATEPFEFTGLQQNNIYDIKVEVRNASNNAFVNSYIKKIRTQEVNAPDLSGFNPDVTYYVTYDSSGNEVKGDKITKDGSNMPNDWYNYNEEKWANIVVDTGTAQTYYTWIPRYEFKLDQDNERSRVNFLQGTSTQTATGYQIPEAFTFNGQELTGYWVSKYTLGDGS